MNQEIFNSFRVFPSARSSHRGHVVSAVEFCDLNLLSCVYTYNFHPGFSLTFTIVPYSLPLISLLSHSYLLLDSSSLEASPHGFSVRGRGSRRGPPLTVLRKLVEITIIIRNNESTILRRVTPRLLASLPTSSECYLSSSSSSS